MSLEFQLPEIGEGVVEGEIVEWHVLPGDIVTTDALLLSVLTDKATVEIAATFTGAISATYGESGDVVAVGATLLTYAEEGEAAKPAEPEAPKNNAHAITAKNKDEGALIDFPMPEIGEGVIEGEVVEWHVVPGDTVRHDQPLLAVLTDKATVEITAPLDGVVVTIQGEPGDSLTVGDVIMTLRGQANESPVADAPTVASAARSSVAAPAPVAVALANNPSVSSFGTPLATPAVRRLAGQLGVNLAAVVGSGPKHRILKADVEAFAALPVATAPTPTPAVTGTQKATPAPKAAAPKAAAVAPSTGERREKLKGLRKAIYTSMTRSKSTIPHFTYVDEIEMDKLVALRGALKAAAADEGVKLSYLPFIVKAVVIALRKFPILNASVDDQAGEIVYKADYNMGIAVATPGGLTVPVVKAADSKSVLTLASEIASLSDRARNKRSTMDDITGGTFTITSLGRLGGLLATPIINHPEVGIMGIHNMEARPVVRDGQITIRQMMNISVSFDHRVVDGNVGASFAQEVKSYLEEPGKLMLHMV